MGDPLLTWLAVLAGHAALVVACLLLATGPPLRQGRRLHWPDARDLRPLLGPFALYWAVIAVHLVEVRADPWVTAWVGRDYAGAVFGLEGSTVAVFQSVRWPPLDLVFLGAYMFGYPFMIYAAPFFYLLHRDLRALRLAAVSFVLLYAATLPFYLFAPVSNPWAVPGTHVQFRLGQLWPDIVPSYWQFTTPNNELPSLHAAISAMTALVAWKAGHRRFAAFAAVFAVLIPVASFAMGVHWILDAVVGEAFALGAVWGAVRLTARVEAPAGAEVPAGAPVPVAAVEPEP